MSRDRVDSEIRPALEWAEFKTLARKLPAGA